MGIGLGQLLVAEETTIGNGPPNLTLATNSFGVQVLFAVPFVVASPIVKHDRMEKLKGSVQIPVACPIAGFREPADLVVHLARITQRHLAFSPLIEVGLVCDRLGIEKYPWASSELLDAGLQSA